MENNKENCIHTDCWFCGSELIWGGDFSFEDYGLEHMGEGVVATLSCPNCEATAEFYTKMEIE